jgi:putative membrane protein
LLTASILRFEHNPDRPTFPTESRRRRSESRAPSKIGYDNSVTAYHVLAPINSILNSIAAVLLTAGFYCIRRHWIRAHRACMLGALGVSTTFFISYCVYHYEVGDVRFQGYGMVRPFYFSILISHITLAAAIVPLALITVTRALRGNFVKHRRIARWTWPIWIYVSITGVVVYLMCYQLYSPGYRTLAHIDKITGP